MTALNEMRFCLTIIHDSINCTFFFSVLIYIWFKKLDIMIMIVFVVYNEVIYADLKLQEPHIILSSMTFPVILKCML